MEFDLQHLAAAEQQVQVVEHRGEAVAARVGLGVQDNAGLRASIALRSGCSRTV
ncbi:MAG TPA: hypothetical protein VGN13_09375 [Solirubrobacteraceae bacterium]